MNIYDTIFTCLVQYRQNAVQLTQVCQTSGLLVDFVGCKQQSGYGGCQFEFGSTERSISRNSNWLIFALDGIYPNKVNI